MDIHKPKPIHNWREFLKEYVIIVLGVATALVGEQSVEWLHWREQVAEARGIVATEMAGNMRLAILRLRSGQCVERRLGELAVILDGATIRGALPPVGDIAMPSSGYYSSSSWESVVASQTATHFPRQQLAAINRTYSMVALSADYMQREISAWNSLYAMVGPGRPLDPATDAKLRDALGQARATNRIMVSASTRLFNQVKALNLPFSPEDLDQLAQGETLPFLNAKITLLGGPGFGSICAPIGPVPPNYGQAQRSFAPALWDQAEKTRPRFTVSPQK